MHFSTVRRCEINRLEINVENMDENMDEKTL